MLARLAAVMITLVGALGAARPEAPPAATPEAMHSATTVELRVRGLRSSNGKLMAALHDRADGFPKEGGIDFGTATISGGKATIVFSVAPGQYAISCFHDENGNGKLDTNWLGIPKEGVCASNDAKARMGPPKFGDAKFQVGDTTVVQSVQMVYL